MVKGLVEFIQFNICSTALTTSLFETVPQYVIVSIIILVFIIVIGIMIAIHRLIGIIKYYINRKFTSIDKHTDRKYQNIHNNNETANTYKEDKKEYQKDVSELEAKIMPDGQTASGAVGKIIEFVKKK